MSKAGFDENNSVETDGRSRILHSAAELFGKRGYHGVSISDVANAAGLVKSAIYHHFPSKEALYIAVLEETCRRSRERMSAAAKGESWQKRLRGAVFVLAELLAPGSHVLSLVFEGIAQSSAGTSLAETDTVNDLRDEFSRAIAHEITEGIAAGDLRRLDPRLASVCLIGLVAAALQAGPGSSDKARVSFAIDLFLEGAARRTI